MPLRDFSQEPMLDMFIFETTQLVEQLEQSIIIIEQSNRYTEDDINKIFRIMHTIKGSSAMMLFENISSLSHSIEDLFYFLREEKPVKVNYSNLTDMVLEGIDFIKTEVGKIIDEKEPDGDASHLISDIESFLARLKQKNTVRDTKIDKRPQDAANYLHSTTDAMASSTANSFEAVIHYEEGCEMENIRAFTDIQALKGLAWDIIYTPQDIMDSDDCIELIRKEGFKIFFSTDLSLEEMQSHFHKNVVFLKELKLHKLNYGCLHQQSVEEAASESPLPEKISQSREKEPPTTAAQSLISVKIAKLDKLMDLVGELVISEAMVVQNPDLNGLELGNFQKAARQLQKITDELQDTVMSIRMVALSTTFQKMNRIVRDMSKKLNKEIRLTITGEETEVDKNIIDHISDPLMHIIRNAIDHGIESAGERRAKGKPEAGTIALEAKNAGGDVMISIKDDGRGLDREKILARARENGLVNRPEKELSDKEIYSYIFYPGFSTKDCVTEFSGRGVGMDVVTKNIGAVGGTVSVDSIPGEGSAITLKIPLTLAIIDGMTIRVGNSNYTVPIISIKESFKASDKNVITDPDGNEMIMIRGQCYPVLRLHERYRVNTEITSISDGIMLMVEDETRSRCIFADGLIGEQQVVVKALPNYIKNFKKARGLAGCTLLGDGSISLILDIADLDDY